MRNGLSNLFFLIGFLVNLHVLVNLQFAFCVRWRESLISSLWFVCLWCWCGLKCLLLHRCDHKVFVESPHLKHIGSLIREFLANFFRLLKISWRLRLLILKIWSYCFVSDLQVQSTSVWGCDSIGFCILLWSMWRLESISMWLILLLVALRF